MSLTRLHSNDRLGTGATLRLEGDRARYLGRVLRLRPGDSLTVFNGEDGEFSARVVKVTKSTAELLVESPVETATESDLRLHLVQGISRGERMDFVVQKATELGVKRITPVFTDYGVVKLDEKRAAKRRNHWEGVAVSACEQSGRIRVPLIDAPVALNTWFGMGAKEAGTDLILQPGAAVPLASIDKPATKVCLLIGPEGGFSHQEYEDADLAGFTAVSLGPRVLRTETAALAALTVAQSLWGDL